MRENTTCTCRACSSIGNLDLKFIVHHGSYVINEVAHRRELAGADDSSCFFTALKNDVVEKTKVAAYALFTTAAVEALGLAELKDEALPYSTETAEFGTVHGAVLDLGARWQAYHAQNEIVVSEASRSSSRR